MRNDAVKNALGESYTAPFRLSTFLLYARSTHDKKSKFAPNGVRKSRTLSAGYPLVGGTRQRRFAGISFKLHKLPENAATPTSRVHAVLGGALTD